MTPRIDRRSFLALGLGAVAWACSRGGGNADDGSEPGDRAVSIVATAQQGLAVGDTRQAFAVFRGQRPVKVDGLRVRLAPPGSDAFEVEPEHVRTARGPGGGDHEHTENTEVTDIYAVRHDFDRAGVWTATLTFDGGRGTTDFIIVEDAPSPIVGKKALDSDSPTTDDPGGVDPICTRTPECSMHEISIADALDAGKPTVVVFGTPRYCTSRTCGPVVDYVEQAKEKYEDKASFIHVEMWKNDKSVNKPDGFVPAFAEWKLQTEPWVYFIGTDGKVRDRWLGALGPEELARAVGALVSS